MSLLGTALWHSRLSFYLWCQHSVSENRFKSWLLWFCFCFPANAPGKVVEAGLSTWVPATSSRHTNRVPNSWLQHDPTLADTAIWEVNRKMEALLLSLSLRSPLSLFQINIFQMIHAVISPILCNPTIPGLIIKQEARTMCVAVDHKTTLMLFVQLLLPL